MSEDKPQGDIIDVEPQIISDAPTSARHNARLGMWGGVGLFGLVCLLGGAWIYRDMLSAYLPSNQQQALTSRVDALEALSKDSSKKVDAMFALTEELKAKIGAAQAAVDKDNKQVGTISAEQEVLTSKLADAQQAVDNLKTSFENLKALPSGAASSASAPSAQDLARIEKLEHDLAALQAAQPKPVDATALMKSLNQVKAKADAGEAYADQLQLLTEQTPAADGLEAVQKEAAHGVPSTDQLVSTLNTITAGLPKSAPAPAVTSNSWYSGITSFFSDLVTVKELGPGLVADAAAKASAFAASGDLQQAADALSAVGDSLPPALRDWKDAALRRMRLDAALDLLSASVARAGAKG
ncbi:MAG: hypothetical protein ABJA10_10430 [Aestuariivirga sp.]